jgi:hypothetical protein
MLIQLDWKAGLDFMVGLSFTAVEILVVDSNFRIPFQQALWRVLESRDHQQIQVARGVLDLTFA